MSINYLLGQDDWSTILIKLRNFNYRAAVVGPHGSGKTTFLEELFLHLAAQKIKVFYCSSENSPISFFGIIKRMLNFEILIIDGFQALNKVSKFVIIWSARIFKLGLVVSQHDQPKLPILLQTEGSLENLKIIIQKLNSAEKINSQELVCQAEKIFLKENANLRHVLLSLYDYCNEIDCEQRTAKIN